MRVLITGMCGFIGHHVAAHFLKETDWELVGLDRIDATSTLHRLRHIDGWSEYGKRVGFVWHDLRAPITYVRRLIGHVDVVLHLAASTHVDRSILDPISFVQDNVLGTAHVLDWWRQYGNEHGYLVSFSTDEVFGPAPEGVFFKEFDPYNSTNPYSAAKAGAAELTRAFSNTYGMKTAVAYTMNVFGERQHPEKFIPMVTRKVRDGETVTIHANKTCTESGSRFYIHAENVGRVLKWLIDHRDEHPQFDKWNIVGELEVSNLDLAQRIARIVGQPLSHKLVDFHSSRPGHDLRYALDGSKLKGAGFEYSMTFDKSLARTVKWYLDHPDWLAK